MIPDSKFTEYYTEEIPTLIPKIPENHISVYPNPASEYVVFDLTNVSESATVELFDAEGKKVMEQKLLVNRQINVSTLRKGLYLYRLNVNGTIYRGKLSVE